MLGDELRMECGGTLKRMLFTAFGWLWLMGFGASAQDRPVPLPPVKATVDFGSSANQVSGFGFSAAFGEAANLRALPPKERNEVMKLLFSREGGAAFNILRLGIETGTTLQAADPGGPAAKPHYSFDGDDAGQVWLAQEAQRYGVATFIADAWSAPPYMKDNHAKIGGSLCGLVDTRCGDSDWKSAFSDYLLQYVRYYRAIGVPIGALGFSNEPEIHVSYDSMEFTPAQAIDMLKTFGPAARASGLGVQITCCDASTWAAGDRFVTAIEADPAKEFVDLYAVHQYGVHAANPLPTHRPVWMTEWSSGLLKFNAQWDCSGCFGGPDGIFEAQDVIQALRDGNVNAYVYWWAAAKAPAALIQITPAGYTIGKRYYALAMVSRFVEPGAFRVESTVDDPDLSLVAFRNPSGGKVVAILNRSRRDESVSFLPKGASETSPLKAFVTDNGHSMAETKAAAWSAGAVVVKLPRRSMTTVVISPSDSAGPIKLATSVTVQKLGDGSLQAAVKITNQGSGPARGVQVTAGRLGKAPADAGADSGSPADLPHSLGDIESGGSVSTSLHFGRGVGKPGATVGVEISGRTETGDFSARTMVKLP